MVETLLDKPSLWLSGNGPDAAIVPLCQGWLSRNLADYPFPAQCTLEEKGSVEERILSALETLGILATGQYCSLEELGTSEARCLTERDLIRPDILEQTGPRGVFVSNDQSLSIVINGEDHLRLQGTASGLQLQEVWNNLNTIDNRLLSALDFAFSEKRGFLTTSVHKIGTGLTASAILHLPALVTSNTIGAVGQKAQDNHHRLTGLYSDGAEAKGDLYRLFNMSTLGHSEEEIIFHVRHLAKDIVDEEMRARELANKEMPRQVEDRIGRAIGVARGARLVDFDEAISLLSSLRLGVFLGRLPQVSYTTLNELMLGCQNAHLEMKTGQDCDELTLNMERADMFRSRFS